MIAKEPTDEIAPPPALINAGLDALPAIIRGRASAPAATLSNSPPPASATNTRMAHARAVKQLFDWCDEPRLKLSDIEVITLAAYIEQLGTSFRREI